MRILFVTPYPPYPPDAGGKIRAYHLIREVARHHDVVLFTLQDATDKQEVTDHLGTFLEAVEIYPVEPMGWTRRKLRPELFRHFHSRLLRQRLAEVLARPGLDLVHVEELCLADLLPASRVPGVLGRQKIDALFYRTVYAADGRNRALKWRLDLARLFREEKRAARTFSGHVVCSDLDAGRLQAIAGRLPCRVVPNGVDLDHFAPAPPATPGRRTLVFTGTMDYEPNVDAARYFVKDIWPHIRSAAPDVEVLFVGQRPGPAVQALAAHPGVAITGSVPDVRPYLREACAAIVPIRIGEGTRLKILEALAMRVPVVSTPAGAEGLQVEDGVHLALAAEPEAFARRTLRLLNAPDEAALLAAAGHDRVRQLYGWPTSARALMGFYEDLVAGAGGASP